MKALEMFSIPIKGLNIGKHEFEFEIVDEFFENFEDTQIQDGKFLVEVELNKQANMMELWFDIAGLFSTGCDRCLTQIEVPLEGRYRLVVKTQANSFDNEEVVYIEENTPSFNLSEYIYQFIHLSRPLRFIKDCESEGYKDCDHDVLEKLEGEIEEEQIEDKNSMWDQLKDIDLEKN